MIILLFFAFLKPLTSIIDVKPAFRTLKLGVSCKGGWEGRCRNKISSKHEAKNIPAREDGGIYV